MGNLQKLGAGLAAALLISATPALAAITVDSAAMVGGRLVVTGHAAANSTVTIVDTNFSSPTGNTGYFLLGAPYTPASCVIGLAAGGETLGNIAVENCAATEAVAAAIPGPMGPAGAGGRRANVARRAHKVRRAIKGRLDRLGLKDRPDRWDR